MIGTNKPSGIKGVPLKSLKHEKTKCIPLLKPRLNKAKKKMNFCVYT